MSDSLRPHGWQPTRLLCPWDFPGKGTRVSCHFLLQGILPIQGSNLGLHHFHQYLVSISLTFFLLWGVAIAEVSHIPPALTLQSIPMTNIPSFATTDGSRLTHHGHPQSIVYIRIHSWCAFYKFKQMYDIFIIMYHTEYFHCPKNHLCSTYSSLTPISTLWQPLVILLSPQFAFLSYNQHYTACNLFILTSFTQ